MEINKIRQELLTRLKRERNGAVVDAVDTLITKTMFSFGVSIPTIKSVISPYKGNHALALNLFQSNVRELKLAAIYIDLPEYVTMDQVISWSETLTTLELFENLTFALLSKTIITEKIIEFWRSKNDPLFDKGVKLIQMHIHIRETREN